MSMMLTPLSRYRSYGGTLHQNGNVVRTVEYVGRFRRAYSYNPMLGVSSTRTAQEHYRLVNDWKTPFEEQLKLLSTEIDNLEPRIKSIRASSPSGDGSKESLETNAKIQILIKQLGGLKEELENRRKCLAEAQSAMEYMNSIKGYEPLDKDGNRVIVAVSTREHQAHHGDQAKRMSLTVKEIAEKLEKLRKERQKIKGLAAAPDLPLAIPSIEIVRSSSTNDVIASKTGYKIHNGSLRNLEIYKKTQSTVSTTTLNSWKPELPQAPVANGTVASLELYGLHTRIDDILRWIGDRETITEAQELGQNYEHGLALERQFLDFVRETEFTGGRRVATANRECDRLISYGHADAATIALWKDNLNEAWENLLELMHTWTLLVEANQKLQKFFFHCREAYAQIQEKMRTIPDDLGKDAGSFIDLQRKHQNLMSDLKTLEMSIKRLQYDGDELLASYAGENALEIKLRQGEVYNAWRQLQLICDHKRFDLGQTRDLFKFMQMANDLTQWIESVKRKLYSHEKPRDIRHVETMTDVLESVKADIDVHENQFSACATLGRELLAQRHYGSWEVEKKLLRLTTEKADLMRYWANKSDHLRLVTQIYHSALTDPAIEPVANNHQYSHSGNIRLEEVIRLINRVKVMDDRPLAQSELFHTLDNLSLTYLKELHQRLVEESKKWHGMPGLRWPSREKVETTFGADQVLRLETTLGIDPAATTTVIPQGWFSNHNHIAQQNIPVLDMANGSSIESTLMRKRTWDSMNRRSSFRAWEPVYCVLRGTRLHFYKDYRHMERRDPLRGGPIHLENCYADIPTDYTKRPHVFRLRFDNGAEYLFQARDDDYKNQWLENLQTATGQHQDRTPSTIPAGSISPLSSSKNSSFFSLKKKF